MKKQILFFTLLISFLFFSCGSSSDYTNKPLDKVFYGDKTIYFKINPRSQKLITFSGMVGTIGGGIIQPNVEEAFRLSINELASETTLKLKFIKNSGEIEDEKALLIDINISEIQWHFGFSVATLKTGVIYKNVNNDSEIKTTGIRKSGGGNEMNNLKKSLKDATYNFLKELEKK
ncbi:hypothetical protein GJU43_18950 [Flavobacterium sp. LC2016-23]|uniref:hypothetical protein n=1 Tax=Flavobacterium sp. LC2016-23 TaxID=2666330 RepID=UPI0012B01FFD|nr:hypothetical protein [Flavobacterium sp. LC2016-23]MRX41372.1 hypothetical protein [Flavobacterium sp. LC2016-23]